MVNSTSSPSFLRTRTLTGLSQIPFPNAYTHARVQHHIIPALGIVVPPIIYAL
ncbi:predicted protein [Plenodomus lingam JN3]|uniref:Predicted protein n=1 Tax=Leptosphaeria maculans (strain JN3 / isolate v23.1.3 / race Av1-4-5-6-7-8) TaxID=985895 RepID=E4ZJB3_LEPMJ|nr:predicted protein [Plenodomus lingam JN3]CBX91544.1 predicted protein [Plenodomus lingam JN3]